MTLGRWEWALSGLSMKQADIERLVEHLTLLTNHLERHFATFAPLLLLYLPSLLDLWNSLLGAAEGNKQRDAF
jgi:hypothetical protein